MAEIVELPYEGRQGEAYRIVQAVLQSITEALWRGEEVEIDGLGSFRVRTRLPMRRLVAVSPPLEKKLWKKGGKRILIPIESKKYVHFTPSKTITRVLNSLTGG